MKIGSFKMFIKISFENLAAAIGINAAWFDSISREDFKNSVEFTIKEGGKTEKFTFQENKGGGIFEGISVVSFRGTNLLKNILKKSESFFVISFNREAEDFIKEEIKPFLNKKIKSSVM